MAAKMENALLGGASKLEAHHNKHDTENDDPTATHPEAPSGVEKTNGAHKEEHGENSGSSSDGDDGPPGGYDDTPMPKAAPGYTLKFTFHRATNLPMADINTFSSDPFIKATLYANVPQRHKEDPQLALRTPTVRRETEPVWNTEWIVANVPASGFRLKCRIYDEDPADHDDRLGNATLVVQNIDDGWSGVKEQGFKIKKRMGSKRAYFMRGLAVALQKTKHMDGSLFLSVENLGRTQGENNDGRCYTIGPMWYTRHYSPMLGRIAGRKEPEEEEQKDGEQKQAEKYNFQANQFQFQGPVPAELYHRFVEFKPFVKRMFTSSGVQGFLLAKALHHQHARVYNYDRTTEYGVLGNEPSTESTLKFLDLVHWDQGGRIFTYVLTLDSLFRFTETGKEFGIDFLSKHTMHSDVNIYIAFSGEFFVRRLQHKNRPTPEEHLHTGPGPDSEEAKDPTANGGPSSEHREELPPQSPEDQDPKNAEHPPSDLPNGPPEEDPPRDPRYYELVIDNDSGTYRPNAELLPLLKRYLQHNLPGMHIVTLDCQADAELQQRMKTEQRERKDKEGDHIVYRQMSRGSDSVSSSDLSDLDDMEGERNQKPWKALKNKYESKGRAVKGHYVPGPREEAVHSGGDEGQQQPQYHHEDREHRADSAAQV